MKLLLPDHWKEPGKIKAGRPEIHCTGTEYVSDWGMVFNHTAFTKEDDQYRKWDPKLKCEPKTVSLSFNLEPIELQFQGCYWAAFGYWFDEYKEKINQIVDMVIASQFPEEENNIFFQRNEQKPASFQKGFYECVTESPTGYYFRKLDWKHLPKLFEFSKETEKHKKQSAYLNGLAEFSNESTKHLNRIHEINCKNIHPLGINKNGDQPKVGMIDNISKYFQI